MGRFPACVILSGVAASRSETATESKDPFLHRDTQPIFSENKQSQGYAEGWRGRAVQQIAQHCYFCRDPCAQGWLYITSEKRRMIRRQIHTSGLGLRIFRARL